MPKAANDPAAGSERPADLKSILESTLVPVEPPEALASRLEDALQSVSDAAAEELADWELKAMRDPRNWVRPAVAIAAGGVAGAALFVLREQRRRQGGRSIGQTQRLLKDAAEAASEMRSRLRP